MRPHPNPRRRAPRPIVHVATGYAIRVRVSRGRLVVEDGVGRDRRASEYGRTDRLSRLIVHGSTGSVTLDAIRWLTATGAALVHLDHAGRLQATTARVGSDNPELRRAQALAADRPVGIAITRDILSAKLDGQREVAGTLDADAATTIESYRAELDDCHSLADLRLVEAQAASAYWEAWRGGRPRFTTRDAARVPVHWTTFTQRVSVLTGTPRVAVDPICATLDYLYSILEAESRIALLAVGLDPGLGILHTDQRSRDSLALDLMEAGRPAVDAYLLALLAQRPFSLKDVHETATGQCRLLPPLTRQLAQTAPTWANTIAPHAEAIARRLAKHAGLAPPATRLTGATRRQARRLSPKTPQRGRRPTVPSVCAECGAEVAAGQRRCSDCHAQANAKRLRAHQTVEVDGRRASGAHPSQTPDVQERISRSQRAQWAARKATDRPTGFTGRPSEFHRLILPKLALVPPRQLAMATGLSRGYCAQIRAGDRVPDIRHWAAFHLAGLNAKQTGTDSH
jgi:CRISPR-associated protein Cas1